MKIIYKILFLLSVLILLVSVDNVRAGDQKLDSLHKILKAKNLDKETKLNTLVAIFYRYNDLKMKKSLEYGSKALDFSKSTGIPLNQQFHLDIVVANYKFGYGNSAFKYLSKLTKEFESNYDTIYYFKSRQLLANLLMNEGLINKSIDQYVNVISEAKNLGLYKIAAESSYELANIFKKIGEDEKVFNFLLTAYKLYDKIDNTNSEKLIEILFEIGENFRDKKDLQTALSYYNKAKDLSKKSGNDKWLLQTTIKMGWTYYLMNELEKAHDTYQKAVILSEKLNNNYSLANALGNLGTIYRDKEEYNTALKYYEKAISYAEENKDTYNLSWIFLDMSELYVRAEKYKNAYYILKKHIKYFEIESSKTNMKKLGQERIIYDAEKKEKELQLLTLRLQKNRNMMFGIAGGTFLILIIAGLFFHQNRVKNQRRLDSMNHKISEITQKNLRQQMNPHFIFNTLNSIQYYMFQNDKISTNNYMTKFSSLMRKTLENSTHTAIPIQDEIDALTLYLELESLRFKEKFKWEIKIDPEIDTLLYKIPTMLIQPYVENSICHGLINKEDQGKLYVELNLKKESIDCTIEDNGIGREAALEIKNKKKGNHNSLGTTITESRLKLVNALYGKDMNIHYEDLKDEGGNPKGTKVIINIPIIS